MYSVWYLGDSNLCTDHILLAYIQYCLERFPNDLIPNTRLKLTGKNPRRIMNWSCIIRNLAELLLTKIPVIDTDFLFSSENLLRPVPPHNNFDVQIRSRPNIVLGTGSTDAYRDHITSSLELAKFSFKRSSPWRGKLGWVETSDTRQFQIPFSLLSAFR